MWNLLISIFGINFIESCLMCLFCIGYISMKKLEKFDLLLLIFGLTSINYLITKFIGIPIMSQIFLGLIGGIYIGIFSKKNIIAVSIKNIFGIFFIFSFCEIGIMTLFSIIFKIEIFKLSLFNLFLLLIPVRIVQFILAYKLSEVIDYENVVRLIRKES